MSLALFLLTRNRRNKRRPAPPAAAPSAETIAAQSVDAARADAVTELHQRHAEECERFRADLAELHTYFDVQKHRAAKGLPLSRALVKAAEDEDEDQAPAELRELRDELRELRAELRELRAARALDSPGSSQDARKPGAPPLPPAPGGNDR